MILIQKKLCVKILIGITYLYDSKGKCKYNIQNTES